MATALFDRFDVQLVAGTDAAVVRDENSSTGELNVMIVGGGISVWFNGRGKVPAHITIKEVEVMKYIAVGGLAGEYADGSWWEREDQFNLMDPADSHEAPKAMKRSWARVNKIGLPEPLLAPCFPGSAGSKDDWDRIVDHVVELHNAGTLSGFISGGAKDKWLQAPLVYPSLAAIRSANLEALKCDPEVCCPLTPSSHTHPRSSHLPLTHV